MDEQTQTFTPEDIEQNKVIAALAYLIFFLPLLAAKDSAYGRFHANQSLVLWLAGVVIGVVTSILTTVLFAVSYYLWAIAGIVSMISGLIYLALGVVAIIWAVNAYNGKATPLPVIGGIKIIK